jgi:hypothetical protein
MEFYTETTQETAPEILKKLEEVSKVRWRSGKNPSEHTLPKYEHNLFFNYDNNNELTHGSGYGSSFKKVSNKEFIRLVAEALPRLSEPDAWAVVNFDRKFAKVTKAELFEWITVRSKKADKVQENFDVATKELEAKIEKLRDENTDAAMTAEKLKEEVSHLERFVNERIEENNGLREELRTLKNAILDLQRAALGV